MLDIFINIDLLKENIKKNSLVRQNNVPQFLFTLKIHRLHKTIGSESF
jgi:hypothetical protein